MNRDLEKEKYLKELQEKAIAGEITFEELEAAAADYFKELNEQNANET